LQLTSAAKSPIWRADAINSGGAKSFRKRDLSTRVQAKAFLSDLANVDVDVTNMSHLAKYFFE
jgi:hypothetical protein